MLSCLVPMWFLLSANIVAQPKVLELKFQTEADALRLVFGLTEPIQPQVFYLHDPERMIVDLQGARWEGKLPKAPNGGSFIQGIRTGSPDGQSLRVVLDFSRPIQARDFWLTTDQRFGHKLVFDMKADGRAAKLPTPRPLAPVVPVYTTKKVVRPDLRVWPQPSKVPALTLRTLPPVGNKSTGWQSVVSQRQRGRNLVIVVDPGHGGKDTGAIGPSGVCEKDVVLAISRRLASRINAQAGLRAVLTRSTDVFIPLRQRVEKARKAHGDMFIAIHADAAFNSEAQGASVFILSERGASSAAARALASRENAAGLFFDAVDKDNLLLSVLMDITLAANMEASSEAASGVLSRLFQVGEIHKESVQFAGFAVLKAPNIPSMLVETAYISNPDEERMLVQSVFQERLATAILGGVVEYFRDRSVVDTKLAGVSR